MDFDTNVENYTDNELIELLNIRDTSKESIITATQQYIDKYEDNKNIVNFYMDIRNKLVKPEEITKVFETTITKGTINPDLKNTISRMINIDSSYRDISTLGSFDSDNYVFTLDDPLTNVVSLMLYSIEIPQSWYTFTQAKGNTQFKLILIQYIDDDSEISVKKYEYPILQISDGNYTNKSLLNYVKELLNKTDAFKDQEPNSLDIVQDPYTGKCKIILTNNFNYTRIHLPDDENFIPLEYGEDFGITLTYKYKFSFVFHNTSDLNNKINYNLGWLLGFQTPYTQMSTLLNEWDGSENVTSQVIFTSSSIIDTTGTKYIIIKLDDYKSNRINKTLVNINTKTDQTIRLPSYFNNSLSKFNTSKRSVNVLPSAPNTNLTAKQIYTINSISNSQLYNSTTNQRVQFPEDSDAFAKIPVKRTTEWGVVDSNQVYSALDNGPGKLIIEFSGPLQLNTRDYFGPVNMTSFAVALYDDKGMILGLNGLDWSFTIIAKSVYQY
jgi:hypothetical protein